MLMLYSCLCVHAGNLPQEYTVKGQVLTRCVVVWPMRCPVPCAVLYAWCLGGEDAAACVVFVGFVCVWRGGGGGAEVGGGGGGGR